jgi:hypothetical protein
LREPFTLANIANSLAQGAEELSVIDHAPVLWGHEQKHHEQISWPQKYRGAQLFDLVEVKAAS